MVLPRSLFEISVSGVTLVDLLGDGSGLSATATEPEPLAGVISDLPAHVGGIVFTGPLVGLVLTRVLTAIRSNDPRDLPGDHCCAAEWFAFSTTPLRHPRRDGQTSTAAP